ncbi:hypothetical protein SteCoe_3562 [Stentor coeruleus]|uniref:C2 NT-type domain-containing protein n=1 Tax=Stentor coeruleus TaxID=5963 RepID=A0A1R2CWR8_9CILI|nr:hypothetical protein SteCoe_3562 [Stentor coeruleus]
MAKLIHRIGAKSVKFDLEVVIHYITISLPEASLLKIRVKRGKDKTEETQSLRYTPNTKTIQFDYPLNFRITMYKKGNKFSKKDLKIKVLQIDGRNEKLVGNASIEFEKCAETGRFIIEEELKLYDCSDSKAVLCTSVKLFEVGKPRNEFFTGNVLSSSNKVPNRRAISIDTPLALNLDFALNDDKARKNSKARGNSFDRDVINLKNDSKSLLETYDSTDFDESELRNKKNTIKGMRAAFHLSQEELDEITGNSNQEEKEKKIDQKDYDQVKKNDREEVKITENYEKEVKDIKIEENIEIKESFQEDKGEYEEVKQEKVDMKEKAIRENEYFVENVEIQLLSTEPKVEKSSKEKKHKKKEKPLEKVEKELEESPKLPIKTIENPKKPEKTYTPQQTEVPKSQPSLPHPQSPPNPPLISKKQDPIPDSPKNLIQNNNKTPEITIEKHKEPISEPESNMKTQEIPQPLPDYLKYEQQIRVSVDIDSHKDLADSSSSDEAPVEVDISESIDSFMPITNLKQSVPNASSQDEKIELKEIQAGLPSSRDSACCASCGVF